MPNLKVTIRNPVMTACPPYWWNNASFYAVVVTCDWYWFDSFPCTEVGPGGGGIYGEKEIPEGTYLVFAYGWPPFTMTDWDWVQVQPGETAYVNLLPTTMEQGALRLQAAVTAALQEKVPAAAGTEALRLEAKRLALRKAQEAIGELQRHLPEYKPAASFVKALQDAEAPEGLLKLVAEAQRGSGGPR